MLWLYACQVTNGYPENVILYNSFLPVSLGGNSFTAIISIVFCIVAISLNASKLKSSNLLLKSISWCSNCWISYWLSWSFSWCKVINQRSRYYRIILFDVLLILGLFVQPNQLPYGTANGIYGREETGWKKKANVFCQQQHHGIMAIFYAPIKRDH